MIRDDKDRPVAPAGAPAWIDEKATALALRANRARQASSGRRRVDPTTYDRDYSGAEQEFMVAMHSFKQSTGNAFPTLREVFGVAKALGYRKSGGAPGGDHSAS